MTIPSFRQVSTFVESQFPDFYKDEGPAFIDFLTSYYEWLEQQGQALGDSRSLPSYADIDTTLDKYVTHFQKEYLAGIPLSIKGDKRFLIKHVLDVYRAKGSIQGFKLLFRLLYNEDIEVYLPSKDIFTASDGAWYQPYYLEITPNSMNTSLLGQRIKGSSSGTEAIVEEYDIQTVNNKIIHVFYLSNVSGNGFQKGEKVIDVARYATVATLAAPTIVGSVSGLQITSGGKNFAIGDLLQATTGSGREVQFRVSNVVSGGTGTIQFNLDNGGTFYTTNALIIETRTGGVANLTINAGGTAYNNNDVIVISGAGTGAGFLLTTNSTGGIVNTTLVATGTGYSPANTFVSITTGTGSSANLTANVPLYGANAQFNIGSISNLVTVTSSTQIINTYATVLLSNTDYLMQAYQTNVSSNLNYALTTTNTTFGTISSLSNVLSGNGYQSIPKVFVQDVAIGANQTGTITYTNTSVSVTGVGTTFTGFANGQIIRFQADSSNSFVDFRIARNVVNNTFMMLDDYPVYNSTGTAKFQLCSKLIATMLSPEALYDPVSNTYGGNNAVISAAPAFGNGVISAVQVKNSGIGYADFESISFGVIGAIANLVINSSGTLYANNDALKFTGGNPRTPASGSILTYANGSIANLNIVSYGSGYSSIPTITVTSNTGSGANIVCTIGGINQTYTITGIVQKSGMGIQKGVWKNTKSFLNADKYLQDSYFYQEYSYQIRASVTLDRYVNVVKSVFHPAGTELFGQLVYNDNPVSGANVTFESYTSA